MQGEKKCNTRVNTCYTVWEVYKYNFRARCQQKDLGNVNCLQQTFEETYSVKLVWSEKDFAVPLTDPEKAKVLILRLVLRDKFV